MARWVKATVHWYLPHTSACTCLVRAVMNDAVQRGSWETVAGRVGRNIPDYDDAVARTQRATNGKVEAGDVQLGLATAALFTTVEVLWQVIIHIARNPELVKPLRDEINRQKSTQGLTIAVLFNMEPLEPYERITEIHYCFCHYLTLYSS